MEVKKDKSKEKKKAKPPITTRVTPQELASIKEKANQEGMSLSKLTRTLLLDYVHGKLYRK